MALLLEFIVLAIALGILLWGAQTFVNVAGAVARRMGVSQFVIGLILIGFGTSIPELSVSLSAAFLNSPGIVVGNLVGSNIANIGFVLAIGIIISPIFIIRENLEEVTIVFLVSAIAALYMFNGLRRGEGLVLLAFLVVYVYDLLMYRKKAGKYLKIKFSLSFARELLLLLLGLAAILIGSRFAVISAANIARISGLTEVLVGITIIAVGTSLPELVTTVYAAKRHMRELALGNIIGSNLFNISAILGLSAIIRPLPTTPKLMYIDLPVMVLLPLILLLFMRTGWRIGRKEGIAFLFIYIIFLMLQTLKI